MKKIILKLILALLISTYSHAQLTINATSSGFTRENSVADNTTNGSFTYKSLPIKRPSWNGSATDGRTAYFNFDYDALTGITMTDAQLKLTYSLITNSGNDGGFTVVLKGYVENGSTLPVEPDNGNYDFSGYTEYSIAEKVYLGGGDYPVEGTALDFDVKQFLIDRLAEGSPKTKVLFEVSIKEKIADNVFFGNLGSNLNLTTSYRPILFVTSPSLSLNKLTKQSFNIIQNNGSVDINFKVSDVDFELLNMNGQILNSKTNCNSKVSFDVTGLSNGFYIVRATNEASSFSTKIIVNNY